MMDRMMGLGWLWMILGVVLFIALILLVAVLIARISGGPRSR